MRKNCFGKETAFRTAIVLAIMIAAMITMAAITVYAEEEAGIKSSGCNHGKTDISPGQGRSVVDAVANHARPAGQFRYGGQFVVRQQFRPEVLYACLSGDAPGRVRVVR